MVFPLHLFAVLCPTIYRFCLRRYSYPFFGSPYPVLVQPPVRLAPNTEATFTQGYCAFDFATTPQHLQTQFCSVPLIVEVWQAQDQLVGVAKVRQDKLSWYSLLSLTLLPLTLPPSHPPSLSPSLPLTLSPSLLTPTQDKTRDDCALKN